MQNTVNKPGDRFAQLFQLFTAGADEQFIVYLMSGTVNVQSLLDGKDRDHANKTDREWAGLQQQERRDRHS
jgi:hypothetical protein